MPETNFRRGAVGLALLIAPSILAAQRDTTKASALNAVVVTAERSPSTLGTSTASVSTISGADIARTPRTTLADVLRRVPGFAVVDFDGLGFDPQLVVRGFYGGGQAEYVILLVDGKPIAQLHTGLVPWSALPPASEIQSIEILRGSASALYGDAAIGAVINVITRRAPQAAGLRWDGAGGSYGTWRSSAAITGDVSGHDASGSVSFDRTNGARGHSARDVDQVEARTNLLASTTSNVALSVASFNRSFDEPGPLIASLAAQDRMASDALFRFDHTHDYRTGLSLDGDRRLGGRMRVSASVGSEWRRTFAVQTLALAPGFGDTQQRDAADRRVVSGVQLDVDDTPLPLSDHLVVGAELARGTLDSKYYAVTGGPRSVYLTASGTRGALNSSATASRTSSAVFEQYTVQLGDPVRLSIGSRFDGIDDALDRAGSSAHTSATETAFSPKVGLNARYFENANSSGHAYVTASESFKAPTLDQRFDQRKFPVPFPPFAITTSNALLESQRGRGIEAGVYHSIQFSTSFGASASASVYQMDMRNEVDFDVRTLRYLNIGRSRHRGVEAGVTASIARTSLFANYTLQNATAQAGDNAGKALKTIPRHTINGGITIPFSSSLETVATVTSVRGAYVDDANTTRAAPFTRADLQASYAVLTARPFVEIRNVFDAKYNSTAFFDPSGTNQVYYYPAAGRTLLVGVRRDW